MKRSGAFLLAILMSSSLLFEATAQQQDPKNRPAKPEVKVEPGKPSPRETPKPSQTPKPKKP